MQKKTLPGFSADFSQHSVMTKAVWPVNAWPGGVLEKQKACHLPWVFQIDVISEGYAIRRNKMRAAGRKALSKTEKYST